jgi:hypothetical protein
MGMKGLPSARVPVFPNPKAASGTALTSGLGWIPGLRKQKKNGEMTSQVKLGERKPCFLLLLLPASNATA